MKSVITTIVQGFIDAYRAANDLPDYWRPARVRIGDARRAEVKLLPAMVKPDHYLPDDILPGATSLVSYFIPFRDWLAKTNSKPGLSSPEWAAAYIATNTMAAELNVHLRDALVGLGHQAAVPENIGFTPEELMSRWSQRHIAWLSGQGTFGMNNMLISPDGCTGRYFSIVAVLPISHDDILPEELCLYKRNRTCGLCMRRCPQGALTPDGFDRRKCWDQCLTNNELYPGAQVCGKCVVGMPCSFTAP
ncbi:MAG: epoxyqueuosine reductase [Planctomycetes bacterium]|nr:epoxyqueuosine reductase [Planctomycetota bacterium]